MWERNGPGCLPVDYAKGLRDDLCNQPRKCSRNVIKFLESPSLNVLNWDIWHAKRNQELVVEAFLDFASMGWRGGCASLVDKYPWLGSLLLEKANSLMVTDLLTWIVRDCQVNTLNDILTRQPHVLRRDHTSPLIFAGTTTLFPALVTLPCTLILQLMVWTLHVFASIPRLANPGQLADLHFGHGACGNTMQNISWRTH